MRTAEEILEPYRLYGEPSDVEVSRLEHCFLTKDIITAINEARKEAIEECALFIEMKALKTREEISPKEYTDLIRSLINKLQ